MAKKAKKVSWRTLARRAGSAAPTVAKRMRAKSAALRRADRAAKGTKKTTPAGRAAKAWATRRANALKKAAESGGLAALAASALKKQTGIDREPTQAWSTTSWAIAGDRGLPGQGELVGGSYSQMADNIAKLARKKGGTDAIQNELAALAASSKYAGSVETDKAATQRLIDVQQIIADRIVCGFIAEVDMAMKTYRGLPPEMVWSLNTFTITKIVDALNKAGYRASGKT